MTRRNDMTARGREILASIRKAGPLMDGSLTVTRKKCGNPECRCAKEGPIHPTALLTWKEGRTTHTRYVPVEDREEVAQWVEEGKRIKRLIKEMSEEQPDPTKQDCELKAFYRLARNLKKRFPRLPICLTLDGLYPNGPVFKLITELGWKFITVLPDESLPSVNAEFEAIHRLQEENKIHLRRADNKTTADYRWVNDISYRDSENRDHLVNVLEFRQTREQQTRGDSLKKFKWVTNLELKPGNVAPIADQGGRIRWKIENEGFNVQKNGGFGLEHAYAKNWTAAKNFYCIMQIAHALFQLMEKGSILMKIFPHGWGSAKDLALRLLEAWRYALFTAQDLARINAANFQIRFDSS